MILLETQRLNLRNVMPCDVDIMFDYRNNEICSRYQRGQTKTHEGIEELVQRRKDDKITIENPFMIVVALKSSNEMIGEIVVMPNENTFSIGYTFSYKYHRQGYAFEALTILIEFLHEKFKDWEFISFIDPDNRASRGLLIKLGYKDLGYIPSKESQAFGKWVTKSTEEEFAQVSLCRGVSMNFDIHNLKWTREPADYTITDDRIEIITKPHTDLWQRTYYHFRNDNAPVLQMEIEEKFFSFTVKTEFESKHRFDQCGVVMYLDSENWLKGSIEYENETFQHLGSVVTNNGYSDWATTEIDADIKSMWYRLSRREDDYCIECSEDGGVFKQMRVCHMWNGGGTIQFGVYACSPEDSSFKATFTNMELSECKWLAHDGQQPDEE